MDLNNLSFIHKEILVSLGGHIYQEDLKILQEKKDQSIKKKGIDGLVLNQNCEM